MNGGSETYRYATRFSSETTAEKSWKFDQNLGDLAAREPRLTLARCQDGEAGEGVAKDARFAGALPVRGQDDRAPFNTDVQWLPGPELQYLSNCLENDDFALLGNARPHGIRIFQRIVDLVPR
jgi:hypothetical protein